MNKVTIKTAYSARMIILFSLIGVISLVFISFGIFLIYRWLLGSIDYILFWTGAMFFWMGSGYLFVITGKIKLIEIRNGILVIRKPYRRKYINIELSKVKYTNFEEELTWNTRKGILIKAENELEQIEIKEYNTSKNLIECITNSCERDDRLKIKIWTKELKWFLFFGLVILTGIFIAKYTQQ